MRNFKLSDKSLKNLSGVHDDLCAVVKLAIKITQVDFCITEGMRALNTQKRLIKEKKTQTLNSRHLTGHAVDVAAWVNGKVSWDWEYYEEIAKAMNHASNQLDVPVEWGGTWNTLKDGCHFELSWDNYPVS